MGRAPLFSASLATVDRKDRLAATTHSVISPNLFRISHDSVVVNLLNSNQRNASGLAGRDGRHDAGQKNGLMHLFNKYER